MSRKAFAVIIKPLCDIYGEPKNWEAKIGLYFDALCDMPEPTLDSAVRQCIRTGEFFPKPAELRKTVRDELAAVRAPLNPKLIGHWDECMCSNCERWASQMSEAAE